MTAEQKNPAPNLPNLRSLLGVRRRLRDATLAALAGLMLAVAYPPLELEFLAWFWTLPILLAPVSRVKRWRILNGYILGVSLFLPSLWWLNTIGFQAGLILGLACAVFPMAWYSLTGSVLNRLTPRPHPAQETPSTPEQYTLSPTRLSAPRYILLMLFSAAAWITLEWIRAWILTGFPWNHLGTSQWQNPVMLSLLPWTGVYGPGFLMICVAFVAAWIIAGWYRRLRHGTARPSPIPAMAVVALFLPVLILNLRTSQIPPPSGSLRVAAVQGNIPQIRAYTDQQFRATLEIYDTLTRQAVHAYPDVDLVVWPETAIPAPLFADAHYYQTLRRLISDTGVPMLIGSLHIQQLFPDREDTIIDTNSALQLNADAELVDFYSKTHLVPFGEYVPFGDTFPALREAIGMGRDLTAGREFTIFNLPKNVRAGVNICYEDAFPEISRQFVLRDADLLVTLTNDAWYATSAGPRQHMIHAVLRAVENRRPLFRSGNNSDTCLILPDGSVSGALIDPLTGNRFVRGWRTYDIPIYRATPLTFYTRHGDLFAYVCTAATFLALAAVCAFKLTRHHRLWQIISQE